MSHEDAVVDGLVVLGRKRVEPVQKCWVIGAAVGEVDDQLRDSVRRIVGWVPSKWGQDIIAYYRAC